MSIASEITNYANGLSDAYDAVNDMQGIIPTDKNMNNLDTAIRTIPQSQGATYTAGNGINIDANNEISVDTSVVAEVSDIPTVYNGTLTIQQNGTTLGTFSANQDTNETINITGGSSLPQTVLYVQSFPDTANTSMPIYKDVNLTAQLTLAEMFAILKNENAGTVTLSKPDGAAFVVARWEDDQSDMSFLTFGYVGDDGVHGFNWSDQNAAPKFVSVHSQYTAGSNITIDSSTNTISATDTTYSDFTGATSSTAGANGLVPAPSAGDENKVLKGDGTWATIDSGTTIFYTDSIYDQTFHLFKDSALTEYANYRDVNTAFDNGSVVFASVGTYSTNFYSIECGSYSYAPDEEGDFFSVVLPLDTRLRISPYEDEHTQDFPDIPAIYIRQDRYVLETTDKDMFIRYDAQSQRYFMCSSRRSTSSDDIYLFSTISRRIKSGHSSVGFVGDYLGSSDHTKYNNDGMFCGIGNGNTTDTYVLYAILGVGVNSITGYKICKFDFGITSDSNKKYFTITEVGNLGDFAGATYSVAGASGFVPAPTTSEINNFLKGDGTWGVPTNTTYSDFIGATASVAGTNGLVPAPTTSDPDKFLKGDGTWGTPTDTTYSAGTNVQISAGNVISATDTTYSNFTGATSSVAGTNGLVPAPAAGDQEKVLHGDGTWKDTTAKLVEMSYGESSAWAKFIAAYNAGSIVYCRASSNANPGTGSQTRKAFMAYVNNATSPTSVEFQYVRSVSSKSSSQPVDQVFVYTLTNSNGGTWSVATRDMGPKLAAGTNTSVSYASGTYTVSATDTTYSTGDATTAGITKLYTTTGQNIDGGVTQKLFTDTVGDVETILQTLISGNGAA